MKIYFLRTHIPWFGEHTGYEQLVKYIGICEKSLIISPKADLDARIRGKLISLVRGYGKSPQLLVDALWRYERALLKETNSIGHILCGEEYLPYVKKMHKKVLQRTVFTFHQPSTNWSYDNLKILSNIKNSILLYSKDIDYFASYFGHIPEIIYHGVDTNFFRSTSKVATKQILFSGVHLRNFSILKQVVEKLQKQHHEITFDFLVPIHLRNNPGIQELNDLPNVTWHSGITDEDLRELYRQSYLLLIPLIDTSANNAIIEALASGLPVITTDVGGIRDYGGGTIYPVVHPNDVNGMVDLVNLYLANPQLREEIAIKARQFSKQYLDWSVITKRHLKFYQSVISKQ